MLVRLGSSLVNLDNVLMIKSDMSEDRFTIFFTDGNNAGVSREISPEMCDDILELIESTSRPADRITIDQPEDWMLPNLSL